VIGCEDRLQNDLLCVEWDVKLYTLTHCGEQKRDTFLKNTSLSSVGLFPTSKQANNQFRMSWTVALPGFHARRGTKLRKNKFRGTHKIIMKFMQ